MLHAAQFVIHDEWKSITSLVVLIISFDENVDVTYH